MATAIATEKVVVKKGDTVWGIAKKYKVRDYKKLWAHDVNKKLFKKYKGNERKLDVRDVVFVPSDLSPLVKAPEPITVTVGKKTYEFETEKERDKFLATVRVVEVKGKRMVFVGKEFDEFKKGMLSEIRRGALFAAQSRVSSAEVLWKHFKEQNDDQYIVAWFVSLAGPDLPSGALVDRAILALKGFESAVASGDFKKIEQAMRASEKPINEAYFVMKKYQKEVEGAAGSWLTALEYTKKGSFAIVGALATPMAVSAAGSAVLGNAIVGGGTAFLSSASNEIGKGIVGTSDGAGEAVKAVGLDTFVGAGVTGLIRSKKGQDLIQGVTNRVVGQFAGRYMSKASTAVVKKYAVQYLTRAGDKLLETAMNEASKKAGAKTKPEAFMDQVAGSGSIVKWATSLDRAIDAEFAGAVYDAMPKSIREGVLGGVKRDEAVGLIDDTLSAGAVSAGKALEGALGSARPGDSVGVVLKNAGDRLLKDKAFVARLEKASAVLN